MYVPGNAASTAATVSRLDQFHGLRANTASTPSGEGEVSKGARSLIIYPSTTLVQDVYQATAKSIRLPTTAILETLIVTNGVGESPPFTLRENEKITVRKSGIVPIVGVLVKQTERSVIVRVKDILVTIANYDVIEQNNFGVLLTFTAERAISDRNINISYEMDGINWTPLLTLYVDTAHPRVVVSGLISNATGEKYDNIRVALMAGDTGVSERRLFSARAASAMMAPPSGHSQSSNEGGALDNYIAYNDIGEITLHTDTMIQLASANAIARLVYTHEAGGDTTKFGYELSGVNIMLPSARMRVFAGDKLLGSADYKQTMRNGMREVILGTSSAVRINTSIIRTPLEEEKFAATLTETLLNKYHIIRGGLDRTWSPYNVLLTGQFTNSSDTDAVIHLRYYRGDESFLLSDFKGEVKYYQNVYIQFDLTVPAKTIGAKFDINIKLLAR